MPKPFLAEICPVVPCCNLSPLPSVLSAVAFYTSEDHYHVSPQSSHFHMMKSLVLSLLPRLRELYLLSSVLSLIPFIPGNDASDWRKYSIWTKPSCWYFSRMIFAFLATLWHCWRVFSLWPTATSDPICGAAAWSSPSLFAQLIIP